MIDKDSHDLYLQSLEEFVLDENRVVTYKWLSKTLGIHVNTAKQLLYEFSTKSDEAKAAGIKKTYLLCGNLQNGRGCNVTIVSEEELQDIKSQYKSVTSEHVYSVQKKKNVTPIRELYKIDRFQKDEDSPLSAITCSKCLPRTDTEVAELRMIAEASTITNDVKQWPKTAVSKVPESKSPSKNENRSNNHISDGETSKKTEDSNSASVKRETKSGTIAAMFTAQNSRPQKAENAKASVKPKAKGGGIATFFNKQSDVKATKSPKKENISMLEKTDSQESCSSSPHKENDDSAEKKRKLESVAHKSSPNKKRKVADKKSEPVETKKTKKGADVKLNNAKKSNKKKEKNEGHDNPAKNRKRIIVADSDSDDDIFEKEELPESPPPPPFEEPEPVVPSQQSEIEDIIPCTPQQELNKGRKRVRKLVDKTFMDDEGYMITKKEFVYESCSESETDEGKENKTKETNESEPKNSIKNEAEKSTKVSPKKNASPPQKSKQATLMSFFKKS